MRKLRIALLVAALTLLAVLSSVVSVLADTQGPGVTH